MGTNSFTYNSSRMSLNDVLDAIEQGDRVLCPECGSELVVALDDETLKRLRVHRGVYCSNDVNHVSILIETKAASGFWEQFKK